MNYNTAFLEALERLNTQQKKAVEALEGPVMVIAGPGTGKTQVIAARIGNILQKTDTLPHNILCLTYTDAATIAMRNRLIKFIGPTAYNINIYTFHAFCNDVIQDNLRYFGGIRELQVINELEEVEIFENLIDDLPNDHTLKRLTGDIYYERRRLKTLFQLMKKENWTVDFLLARADQAIKELEFDDELRYKRNAPKYGKKKGDLKEKDYNKALDDLEKFKEAVRLFTDYNERLAKMHRYDFSDMILWVLKAFQDYPDLLLDYQEKYQYFLVDEYQDTNGAQNDLLYSLCDYWEAPNVFVVGDDDQSIYRFQGANMENILTFKEKYQQHLTEVVLTENYRSNQEILDASRQLIIKGDERLESRYPYLTKALTAARLGHSGSLPKIQIYHNTEHEKADLIQHLTKAKSEGENLSKYAVLYRNHSDVESIVKALEQKGIPLNLKKKFNVLEVPWINQIINICRYISAEGIKPYSGEHFLPILMHYRYFNIHPLDIARISTFCAYNDETKSSKRWKDVLNDNGALEFLKLKDLNAVKQFRDNLNHWIKDIFNETVQVILERILNFGGILGDLLNSEDKAWKMQLLTTLFDFIKEESRRIPFMKISDMVSTIDKMQSYNIALPIQRILYNSEGVHFITAHSSKGLEFEHVFIINAISKKWEGKSNKSNTYKLPKNLVQNQDVNTLEDERRLFYVAMTRAEKQLYISYAEQTADEKSQQKSRFVAELQNDEVANSSPQPIHLSDQAMFEYGIAQLLNKDNTTFKFLDHNEIDKVLEKFKLSVTALNKYLQCPISFYFENILRVPSARTVHTGFGNVIHSTLEIFHNRARKTGQFGQLEDLIQLFDEQMHVFHSHFTEKEYQDRQAFGHQFLPGYYKHYIDHWKSVPDFRMEYNISQAVCQDVPIKGRLDKVELKNNKVTVIDFKTGKHSNAKPKLRPPKGDDDKGGDYWRQIVYYRILIENDPNNNWTFDEGIFDFVQPDQYSNEFKLERFEVTDEEKAIVESQIKDSYTSILNHEFEKGCNEEDCTWCNFVKYNNLDLTNRGLEEEPEEIEISSED